MQKMGDHHLSYDSSDEGVSVPGPIKERANAIKGPMPRHKRIAMGEKVAVESNPYGGEKVPKGRPQF